MLGRIPASRLYAPGMAILNAYPLPNASGAGYNYESQVAVQIDRREEIFRADWQASSAWRVYGRYFHNSNNAGAGIGPYGSFVLGANLPRIESATCARSTTCRCRATGVISPTLFFEVTFGTGHNSIYIHDSRRRVHPRQSLGVSALPLLYPAAVSRRLSAAVQPRRPLRHAAEHQLEQVALRQLQHDLRLPRQPDEGLGPAHVEVRHLRPEEPEGPDVVHATTTASSTSATTPPTRSTPATRPPTPPSACSTTTARPTPTRTASTATGTSSGSLQDNWKVNDRLTLDYGLRFYWVQPQHDEAGLTSNFIPELFDANQAVRLYRPGLIVSGHARRGGPGHRPACWPRSTSAASCRTAAA